MNFCDDHFRFYCLTRQKLNTTATDCYQELQAAYGPQAPSKSTVFRWYAKFKEPKEDDNELDLTFDKPRSSRPRTVRNQDTIQRIKDTVTNDPRISIRELPEECDVSFGTVHTVLHEELHLRNVSSVWVPYDLSDANKQARINRAKHFQRLHTEYGISSL